MAGTIQYLWKIVYVDGREPDYVISLAPVKTKISFANGTYRDLNGSGQQTISETSGALAETVITTGSPDTAEMILATPTGTPGVTGPDDLYHIAPRPQIDPFDCWVFTNTAGDVVSTVKCNDVLNYVPVGQAPLAQSVTPVVPADDVTPLIQTTNFLYVVGGGDVAVVYPDGHEDIITCPNNSVRAIQVSQIKQTGTSATGILVW
jgi:hypothetical protein